MHKKEDNGPTILWLVRVGSFVACLGWGIAFAAPATHFSVVTSATASAGTTISVAVSALDSSNAVDSTYGGTVHFTSSDLLAILPADAPLVNGVRTLSVTLNTVGLQTITATDTVTSSISGSASVTVLSPLNGTPTNFAATQGIPFIGQVATFTSANLANTAADFTATINWGDGTTTAATISGAAGSFAVSGTHTYATSGTFAVTVTVNDSNPPASITIADSATVRAVLQSIVVTPTNPSIPVGTAQQFTATGTLSDNSTQNLTNQVTWASGTPSVATINASGLATGVSAGSSSISATLNGITGSTALTVAVAVTTQAIPTLSDGLLLTLGLLLALLAARSLRRDMT